MSPGSAGPREKGTPHMARDLNVGPIDATDQAQWGMLLENLQGNILKGHGRNHTVHLLFRFSTADADANRDWIQRFARSYVTSAARQLVETRDFQQFGIPGRMFGNFLLSANGY